MAANHFQKLVDMGNPVGTVIGVNKFLITVSGLQPCNTHALVMFDDGSKGFVHHIYPEHVLVLHLGSESIQPGMGAVVQHKELVTKVGKNFMGRVINVIGEPLDGKGPIAADSVWPVFNEAPPIYQRERLSDLVETGVTLVDTLFPIVRGQRMAMLGESKSGKSTLATQLAINQKNTDILVIYVLIAKRRSDVDELLGRLEASESLHKSVVIVSTLFESLIMSYLAPYVGCALAEYFWQKADSDTMIIYDDLTSHAQAYREVALISLVSPGRESYPGDMFYAHSSLLERAGRLKSNHKTLTSIPLVLTPSNDITAFLPTNIMSITDGQWILDMEEFRESHRPAVSTGLSVTRVGGVGQSDLQHKQAMAVTKVLSAYNQALEYSHFGSELALGASKDLSKGKVIYEVLNQPPTETYSLLEQQLMLAVVLDSEETSVLDIATLKTKVRDIVANKDLEGDFDQQLSTLKGMSTMELKRDGGDGSGDKNTQDSTAEASTASQDVVGSDVVAAPDDKAEAKHEEGER